MDIRVAFQNAPDMDALARVQEGIKDRYPERQERAEFEFGVQTGDGGTPAVMQRKGGPVGYFFRSADGKNIMQARHNGFAFSRLRPYGSGDAFRQEARELWQHYRAIVRPLRVNRLALRNINRIEIPVPFGDFRDYILTSPEIAPGLPQGLAHYLLRLVMPHPEHPGLVASVISSMEAVTTVEGRAVLPVIFDIDVFQEVDLDPEDSNVWGILGDIRQYRNEIFFKSMTDKALELFNE
jgi:uncharacterized protein (TIGR04255 family)